MRLVDPQQWTVAECAAWLESIDLGELREVFGEQSIGGAELVDLSEDDLKSMGISKLGHRKKLIKKIAALRGDSTAGSSSATATTNTGQSAADSSDNPDSDEIARAGTYRSIQLHHSTC